MVTTEKGTRKKLLRTLLLLFFLTMLLFTVLTRILDSYGIPKVTSVRAKKGNITTIIDGTGSIHAKEVTFIDLIDGLKADTIAAGQGKRVEAGDLLFTYLSDSILDKKKELEKELEKLQIGLLEEQAASEIYHDLTEGELAAQELHTALQELELGENRLQKAEEAYEVNVRELKREYDSRSVMSAEELEKQRKNAYRQSRKAYEEAGLDREKAIKDAKREVEDIEKKIEKLEALEGKEDEISDLLDELERKQEDLDRVIEKWDLAVERAEMDMDEKEELYDGTGYQDEEAEFSLREQLETALKQEENILEGEKEKTAACKRAVEKAEQNLDNAGRRDEKIKLTNEQSARLSSLRRKRMLIDIEWKQEELNALDNLLAVNGKVTASENGYVVQMELEPGKTITGGEQVQISKGSLEYSADFVKEDGSGLKEGDKLAIRLEGEAGELEAVVTGVNLLKEETGAFYADIPGEDAVPGQTGRFTCKRISDIYQTVIPLSALHEDSRGYYCLVAQTRKTILGEELTAVRVNVELEQAGDTEAAIKGPVYQEDRIISSSDRMMSEGDRVRVINDNY